MLTALPPPLSPQRKLGPRSLVGTAKDQSFAVYGGLFRHAAKLSVLQCPSLHSRGRVRVRPDHGTPLIRYALHGPQLSLG